MTPFKSISDTIKNQLDAGVRRFIIYPFGEYGFLAKQILNNQFGIKDVVCVDRDISKYNPNVKDIAFFDDFNNEKYKEYKILLVCGNILIHEQLIKSLNRIDSSRIIDVFCFNGVPDTKIGRYSYGSLCNPDWLVEKIGNFCSFAEGVTVVANHTIDYISTHPMMYYGQNVGDWDYGSRCNERWYFPGVNPKGKSYKGKRVVIGNDVWLGRNVIIANGARIGNGVIAGAGAVITKNVPDYAVVGGVPAKVIRYRFSEKQIDALNKICWWDWPDEKIRQCFEDFYLPVDKFIRIHLKK